MSVELRTRGADQLRELSRALKKAGRGDLRKRMLQEIRTEARPIVAKTKQAALDIPATKGVSRGTRRAIAAAVGLQVRQSGVRIRVNTKKLGQREALPRGFESPRGWRHPVPGTNQWVRQAGHPWFFPTIQANTDELRRKVVRVLDEIADELERSV